MPTCKDAGHGRAEPCKLSPAGIGLEFVSLDARRVCDVTVGRLPGDVPWLRVVDGKASYADALDDGDCAFRQLVLDDVGRGEDRAETLVDRGADPTEQQDTGSTCAG